MSNRVFTESQTYRGTWLIYLILMLELPTVILLIVLFFTTEEKQEMGFALILVFGILSLIFLLIFNIRFETRLDNRGVQFRYLPFIRNWKLIPKHSIRSIEVITYNPIFDYGGWGMKGNKTTKAYNIAGDVGLLIDSGESKKTLLGTQKAVELKSFVADWIED